MNLAESIARSLHEVGVRAATHVPGHGASQTFAAFRDFPPPAPLQWGGKKNLEISFHEEAAYAVAHGVALCGVRSACIIKSHGLTKAMNAVMDSLSCGVTAGMVNLIFEDKGGSHSDNIIEILPLIKGAEMPHKISRAKDAYDDVIEAIRESERLQLPFTLVIDADEMGGDVPLGIKDGALQAAPMYRRDIMRHVVCPIFAPYQREVLLRKLHSEEFEAVPRPPLPSVPESLP